jgi:hypothetical protein
MDMANEKFINKEGYFVGGLMGKVKNAARRASRHFVF